MDWFPAPPQTRPFGPATPVALVALAWLLACLAPASATALLATMGTPWAWRVGLGWPGLVLATSLACLLLAPIARTAPRPADRNLMEWLILLGVFALAWVLAALGLVVVGTGLSWLVSLPAASGWQLLSQPNLS